MYLASFAKNTSHSALVTFLVSDSSTLKPTTQHTCSVGLVSLFMTFAVSAQ